MFVSQRQDFSASSHLELPGMPSDNPWQRAFEWSRVNTPTNALFALDPDYVNAPGEDHRGFRAVAERSALADRSKDGGVVAVFPDLAEEWTREVEEAGGVDRVRTGPSAIALRQAGVTWIVTKAALGATLDCPYRNYLVAVCHLPDHPQGTVNKNNLAQRNGAAD
jgi:hypothetical protein